MIPWPPERNAMQNKQWLMRHSLELVHSIYAEWTGINLSFEDSTGNRHMLKNIMANEIIKTDFQVRSNYKEEEAA